MELGSLANLETLSLRENQLTGPIPAELGSLANLERLDLLGNQLSGPIPPELGSLANLQRLNLGGNQLTGEIPAELGSLANLEQLYLFRNQLTGPIPAQLGSLANLERLYLRENLLTGCIPEGLRNVPGNDLAYLGLPFCDVLLSGLSISPRRLTPPFDPYHTEYGTVTGLSPVTVTPTNDGPATVRFLDENDGEIADADGALDGHQVEIGAGVTTIKVEVTSRDQEAANTYTIMVTYEDLGIRYDENNNGVIDRDEVISAIADYFKDAIGREEVIRVIQLYFSS